MDIFGLKENPKLLDILHTDVVMVALNFSTDVSFEKPFMNFHSARPSAQDYKIRYAFKDTPYYGAYMTDIIKVFPMLSSIDVMQHLKDNPGVLEEQLERFRNEMAFIGAESPLIIAFGKKTYDILKRGLSDSDYSSLVQVTHYSHHIGKEKYRDEVLGRLNAQ